MARRRARPRRSVAEWGVRAALAVAAAGLGYASVAHSLAYMMRGTAPARAHALAPWDGRITALLSEQLSGPEASVADRTRADELARRALCQDPTAVAAAVTLGINAQIRGDTAAARQIFAYSEMLSRRDLRMRLWAIEDAVGRNDIPAAMRNYDIALRTSRIAPDLLFPVLAKAIDDADIRRALIGTLLTRPAWAEQFITFVSGNGRDAGATAQLLAVLERRGVSLPTGTSAMLIGRMLAEGHVEDAWRYYAATTPGVDRLASRDPDFAVGTTAPTAFDWQPVTDSSISATIQRGGDGGIFYFAVPMGLGGPILRQTQLLSPGRYRIDGHSIGIDQAGDALSYWTLRCGEGRELGRVDVPNSAQDDGRFSGDFTVPTGCPVQELILVARASEASSGLTGQIDDVRLRPAGVK